MSEGQNTSPKDTQEEERQMVVTVLGRYSPAVQAVRAALADHGWEVYVHTDDGTLPSAIPFGYPDLIVVDVGAHEGETGWETLAKVRSDSILSTVPTVVTSDNPFDLRNHADRLQDGVAAVLVQPFTEEDMRSCVAAVTGRDHTSRYVVEVESRQRRDRTEPEMGAHR